MQYQRLFSLNLYHEYYRDQICTDFTIVPTQACQKLLRGYRLIVKNTVNGFWLLVPVDGDQKPVIPFSQSLTLTFLLKLNRPELINFTALDPDYTAIASIYAFSNQDLDTPGVADLSPVLVHRPRGHPPDRSLLATRYAQIAELNTAERQAVFGIVEIHNNASLPTVTTQPSEFKITFPAKPQIWKYYLVTDKNTPPNTFSIQDKASEITFIPREIAPGDRVVTAIQQRFPESQPYLFQSSTQVVCQEAGRQEIQLLKNGQTTPWIPHLPTPPNQHGTQVINVLEDV